MRTAGKIFSYNTVRYYKLLAISGGIWKAFMECEVLQFFCKKSLTERQSKRRFIFQNINDQYIPNSFKNCLGGSHFRIWMF